MHASAKPLLLGDFELETLDYLWSNDHGNAKSVHAAIGVLRGNSLNTVQSTLDRLYRKGVLHRNKVGHSYQYICAYSRTEVLARKFGDLATELSGGEIKSVLAAFVEFTARLDDTQMDELELLIANHKLNSKGQKNE